MPRIPKNPRKVFPTQVGVNQVQPAAVVAVFCIPHAGGGEPLETLTGNGLGAYSPRRWG